MANVTSTTEILKWATNSESRDGKIIKVHIGSRNYSTFVGIAKYPKDANDRFKKYATIKWLSDFYVINRITGEYRTYKRFTDAVKFYHDCRKSNDAVLYQIRKLADGSLDESVVAYF